MKKDGACKMDRQNKICSYARKSGWRKNNAGTDKEEEKKLAVLLAKKELSAEGCYRKNGKREEHSTQKKISDDRQHYGECTVPRYENEGWEEGRVENAEFAVKTWPWAEYYDWLIDWLIDWLVGWLISQTSL